MTLNHDVSAIGTATINIAHTRAERHEVSGCAGCNDREVGRGFALEIA